MHTSHVRLGNQRSNQKIQKYKNTQPIPICPVHRRQKQKQKQKHNEAQNQIPPDSQAAAVRDPSSSPPPGE